MGAASDISGTVSRDVLAGLGAQHGGSPDVPAGCGSGHNDSGAEVPPGVRSGL